MRLRIMIDTRADVLPWKSVLRPGRSLAYDLLARGAPQLGARLHEQGWGQYGMVPFGHGAPLFPEARRRQGRYVAGGPGVVEFGSPLPDVVDGWAKAIAERDLIDWGGVAFRVRRVEVMEPPAFSIGRVRLRTVTPVVMKGSGCDGSGVRRTRQAWVLPTEPEFPGYLAGNLRRKAQTLGLESDVELESITWAGPKRSFAVSGGLKPGAAVEVEVRGSGSVLQALWSWGLGQANAAGFGWVGA